MTPFADAVAAVWVLRRALRGRGAERGSWGLLAVGLLLWTGGDTVWLMSEVGGLAQPGPSAADVFYVTGSVMVVVALIRFPADYTGSRRRLLADAVVLSSALALVAFMVVLEPLLGSIGGSSSDAVYSFYPVADLLMLVLAGLIALRGSGRRRPDLVLIATGCSLYAVTDSAFATAALQRSYDATDLLNFGYVVAPLVVGLAALAPVAPVAPAGSATRHRNGRFAVLAPDLAVLVALVTCAVHGMGDWADWTLAGLTIAVAGSRQPFIASENERLREGLEHRVRERTTELDALARRHGSMLDAVGDGIYGVDPDGRISFMNPAAARMLGLPRERLVGRDACATLHGAASHHCPVRDVLDGRAPSPAPDLTYIRADGSRFPVEVSVSARTDESVPARSVVVVLFRDVTERRAMETMKSEFISVVSHELRTPLTSIRGALGLLADGDLGELPTGSEPVVEIALRGSERLTRLIDDILVMERLESGGLPLDLRGQPVGPLVEAAVQSVRPIAEVEGVLLGVAAVDADVVADGDRLVQVLINLLSNAVKFTAPGKRVDVEVRRDSQEEGFALVTVSDEGRGIPAHQLDAVFERFLQVDADDSRRMGGSGLGLAISRSIVEQHGGRIWAESQVGHGSQFRFTVPLVPTTGPRSGAVRALPTQDLDPVPAAEPTTGPRGQRAGFSSRP